MIEMIIIRVREMILPTTDTWARIKICVMGRSGGMAVVRIGSCTRDCCANILAPRFAPLMSLHQCTSTSTWTTAAPQASSVMQLKILGCVCWRDSMMQVGPSDDICHCSRFGCQQKLFSKLARHVFRYQHACTAKQHWGEICLQLSRFLITPAARLVSKWAQTCL